MHVYRQLKDVPESFGPTVATIGNFDGVHRGHRWVIESVIRQARARGARSLVITFDPHPARAIRPEINQLHITPLEDKLLLLAETGIDAALVLPFTGDLARMSARSFAEEVLKKALSVVELHEGENFRFGYQAEGGVDTVRALGQELGFEVFTYSPKILGTEPISSSRVRSLLVAGQVSAARRLLGRPFAVVSTPASGRGYGTRYTVPTINLAPYAELLPAKGVYVTSLAVGEGASQEIFEAVTNVGDRPTFGADSFAVESHLLNFHPIALDEQTPLKLSFLLRLRPEIRWSSPEALREQIGRDVAKAKRYFSLCKRMGNEARV